MSQENGDNHSHHGEEGEGADIPREQYVAWYTKHLVQLQCTDQNWEGPKIPEAVAHHILGDLTPLIRAGVYLKDQRLLLDVNLQDESMSSLRARLGAYRDHFVRVGGYSCKFTFYSVGGYPDLVDIMTNVMTHGHDGSVLETDVVSNFPPVEVPAFQYLMFAPPGHSTPAKSKGYPSIYRGAIELIDKLPPEYAQRAVEQLAAKHGMQLVGPKPASTPVGAKGEPHVSVIPHDPLQESILQTTSMLVQEMVNKGVLKGSTPKLEQFSADPAKITYSSWESRVKSFEGHYTDAAIKEAMQNSLKGRPAKDIEALAPNTHWKDILAVLRIKYQNQASYDALLSVFYSLTMGEEDDCASFSTKLEQQLNYVMKNYPGKLQPEAYTDLLKERFFHGIPSDIRTNTRSLFDDSSVGYYALVAAARKIESEQAPHKQPSSDSSSHDKKDKSVKVKPKVAAVQVHDPDLQKLERTVSQTSSDMQEMQRTLKELTQAMGKLQQASASPISSPQSNQSNPNYQPASGSGPPPRGRGGFRGGFRGGRGRGGFGRGGYGPALCYWCEGKVPDYEARHYIKDCPFYSKCKDNWWTGSQSALTTTPEGATAAGNSNNSGN